MQKNYILDTNVLLHDPNAIHHFEENIVVIPLKVIEEIDKFKRDVSELGRNARQFSRICDDLRHKGKLSEGVPLESKGLVRIAFPGNKDNYINGLSADDQILKLAMQLSHEEAEHPCIVVSKDINLRLKADALGLEAQDYETNRVNVSELFSGNCEMEVNPEVIEELKKGNSVTHEHDHLSANEYVLLRENTPQKRTFLARYDLEASALVPLIMSPEEIKCVHPRNREQYYAMDALLNDSIKVVTIIGKAGTGKTLLAIAAALYKTFDTKVYRKMLVCRPTFPMGKDIGYLPGTVEEKLNPWMQPVYDALDLLASGRKSTAKKGREAYEENDKLAVEPLTYIRGRSIPNQYIVIDEAQNLTPLEVKTIVTRVGHGTKIVLTGDIYQIDNPYVDSMSNGLTCVVEKFRAYPLAAHVMLSKGVRSDVAELAANVL